MRYARTAWEWDLVGGDPTPGDPCAYEMLSGFFAGTAENAGEASCRLRRLGQGADDTIWRGASADAFREDLDELPKKLDKLYDSYHEASEALRLYGLKLRGLQVDADLELQSAVGADDEVKALVDQTTTDCGGPAMGPAAGAVVAPPAPDPTEEARARLAKARAAVEQIRQDREGAEAQVVERLEHASDLGLQNKGFFDRIAGWVGDRIDDARDLHHKMLRAIGDLADRLADVLTIVAIAWSSPPWRPSP